jgi:prepilin-type N-terminal cleavage/methylation domain-containing protein
MTERSRPRAGFTLIETLVALVVLAVVMLVAQRGMVAARFGLDRVQSATAAQTVARGIVETQLDQLAPEPGIREGVTDGLAWTVVAEPLDLPFPAPPTPAQAVRDRADGGPPGMAAARASRPTDDGAPTETQGRWRPLRVTVRVANGRGVPLTVETVHVVKEP